jgi:hypothetical protein
MEVRRLIAAGSGPLATCRERVAAGLALPDRWAYVTTALFSALLFSAAAYRIAAGPQAYPDLIVGNLAWAATTKRQDYAALLGLLGGFAIALPFLLALAGWARSRRGAAAAASLHHLLAMASVPAFIWVGSIALRSVTDLHLLVLGGVLTTLTALVATIAIVRPDGVPPDDFRDGVAASVCIVVLSAAMPFVVALVVGRAGPWLHWRPIDVHAWTGPALPVGLASVALVFVIVVWSPLSRTPQKVRRRLQIALRAVQAPALLFFLAIIPVPWQGDQNLAASVRPSTRLWLLVVLFLTVGLIDLWRRTDAGSGKWFDAALSPAVALSVLVILGSPDVGVAAIPKDDFHFGEFLTPFWAWRQHALIPYWDYAPARGLTNYTSGLMSAWLFDGSAASLQTAQSVSRVLYWAITVPILARPLGVIGALIASLLMAPPNGYSEVDTLVTAGLVIVVQTYLTRRPATFLGVWGLVGTALVLIAPGQGGLLVLATLPLGTPAIVAAWSSDRRRLIRVLLGSLGAALGLLATTPFGKMLAGAVRYGIEQAPLNSVANGIPWAMYETWLRQALRFSWLGVGLGAALLALMATVSTSPGDERRRTLAWASPIALLCALFVEKAAGRIDPGTLSRAGLASIWMVALLAPLLAVLLRPEARRDAALVTVILVAALVRSPAGSLSVSTLWHRPVARVTPDSSIVVGAEHGLPAIGTGQMSPEHLARLVAVKRVLDRVVEPGETYLDVTNRSAQYFYFNLPPPIESGAYYNLISGNQNLRAVRRLSERPPPIALVYADNILHDGGTTATRAHLLYRFLIRHYEPVEVEEQVFMVRPDRLGRILPPGTGSDSGPAAAKLALLDRAFLVADLRRVPQSWGASLSSLRQQIREVSRVEFVQASAGDPTLRADLTPQDLAGKDVGLLQLTVVCLDRVRERRFSLAWSGDRGQASGRIVFGARGGKKTTLLVPLDVQPRWLLTNRLEQLRLGVDEPSCKDFRVTEARFHQRRIVDAMPPSTR